MSKKELIGGITGQDGGYLAERLFGTRDMRLGTVRVAYRRHDVALALSGHTS